MSEDSNKKISLFLVYNLSLFLFYSIAGSAIFGNFYIIAPLLLCHAIILAINGIFSWAFKKSAGQTFGYAILFFLFLGIIGFSICAGSINIH